MFMEGEVGEYSFEKLRRSLGSKESIHYYP